MTTYSAIHIYARFSSREQAEGMSLARQISEATDWLAKRDMSHTGTILDEGRSGFHGHHRHGGALGEFEADAAAGLHMGSLLVVERIDRLSREGHAATMALINSLTAAGVTIATVKTNRIYKAGEQMSLVEAITVLVEGDLAHQESVTKSDRTASNWRIRRERAAMDGKAMSAKVCPPWVCVVDGKYELDGAKVAIIEHMFRLADDGAGATRITRELNRMGKPANWSNSGRAVLKTNWNKREVVTLLSNRAVVGECQPRKRVGNLYVPNGDPIVGMYPPAIDPALFARVSEAAGTRKAKRGGAKSTKITNLLSGQVFCRHCDGRAILRGSARYFRCQTAHESAGIGCSNMATVRYGDTPAKGEPGLESTLLKAVLHLAMDDRAFSNSGESAAVMTELAETKRKLELAETRARNLSIQNAEKPNPLIGKMADEALAEHSALTDRMTVMEKARDKARGRADSIEHLRRVDEIRDQMDDPKVRLKAAHALHNLIERVEIDDERNATIYYAGAKMGALRIRDGKIVGQAAGMPSDLRKMAEAGGIIGAAAGRMEKSLIEAGAVGFGENSAQDRKMIDEIARAAAMSGRIVARDVGAG